METPSQSSQQPQFFFHVPKTGGSTIQTYFVRRFGSEHVLRPEKSEAFLADVWLARKFKRPSTSQGSRLPSIAGHFASLSLITGQEADYFKVCFWRHPADYALSRYNWHCRRKKDRIKRRPSLMDYVRSHGRNPMTQDLLLYCGDLPGWRYFFMSDQSKFETAVRLARRFDLFADIAEVNSYLQTTGFANAAVERHNTVSEKAIKSLDTAMRVRLEQMNPVDFFVHLYTHSGDKSAVLADARRNLSSSFSTRDLIRFFARPYFRCKVNIFSRA
jgi:hypothetical protein